MWPFFITRDFVITKRLATSKENVLAVLRPDIVLRTNPILTSVIPDVPDDAAGPAGEPRWYKIVEKVPLVGGLDTSTSFRCQWTDVADGVDMKVFAGAGTRLTTSLRVTPVDGGEVEYSDHVILEVSNRLTYEVGAGANLPLTRRDCSCSCHSSFRGRRGATVFCGILLLRSPQRVVVVHECSSLRRV